MMYQLTVSALIFLPSIIAAVTGRKKESLWLLLLAAFAIRLMMIGLDPYLHDWDERFHAVVAKNMMRFPFKPMLRTEAILPYNPEEWCCNYIWVHKQPLFLWQMALSMKIFGVNVIGLRLPNVLMETFTVYCVYRIAELWTRSVNVAYIAALLWAASYYGLELCSGMESLDHNDLMMGGYVTASFWAFCEYTEKKSWKWALWVGVFAGCAILVKWLTGLLVFGGWGIYLLMNRTERTNLLSWKHLAGALGACILVFMPWQIYIKLAFPAESAIAYAYNIKHITDDLGHPGNTFTHLAYMTTAFSGSLLILLMIIGSALSFRKPVNRVMSLSMLAMFVVVYAFFSIFVATKMRGLTYPVASIAFVWMAIAVELLAAQGRKLQNKLPATAYAAGATLLLFALTLYTYKPNRMARSRENADRDKKIHNTEIYRKLNQVVTPDEVVLNCKSFEDTEVRFWQPNNAYHWYPTANQIDSLLQAGYKLAAFKSHHDQALPGYMINRAGVKIIDWELE